MTTKKNEDNKENFCGVCTAIPLAFVGTGISSLSTNSKGSNKKYKKILLWSGIITVIVSFIIIYYNFRISKCSKCVL